jgi:hypothetical protein
LVRHRLRCPLDQGSSAVLFESLITRGKTEESRKGVPMSPDLANILTGPQLVRAADRRDRLNS